MENAGSDGKCGVDIFLPKIWIFLAKMRSQNFVTLYCDDYQFSIAAWNALLDQKSKLNISWERKPFKTQRVLLWFFFGHLLYFSQQLAFFTFEKEIMNVLTAPLFGKHFFQKLIQQGYDVNPWITVRIVTSANYWIPFLFQNTHHQIQLQEEN